MASIVTKYAILRVAKLTTLGNVAASGQHTFRERPTPNAEPERTGLNAGVGASSAAELVEAVKQRVALATERAKDPVLALEYLVTATPEAFKQHGGTLDARQYLNDALKWLRQRHGAANVVCAHVHQDEHSPHLVAYVVPLVEKPGKTRKRSVVAGRNPDGSQRREIREFTTPPTLALSAKHFVGGRTKLSKMQTDFAKAVGKPHGLQRGIEGSKATHQRVKRFYRALSVAQQPAPQLGLVHAWQILRGETPEPLKHLATVAKTATTALSLVRTGNQSSDRQRAAEAARIAAERSALEKEKSFFEAERELVRVKLQKLTTENQKLVAENEALAENLEAEKVRTAELKRRLAQQPQQRRDRSNGLG